MLTSTEPDSQDAAKAQKASKGADGHFHLAVATPAPAASRMSLERWAVILLALASAGLFAYSFYLPWWDFQLYAPQYPKGLKLVISLTGVTGDVKEINILNHYIGMKSLENAAPFERSMAGYGIAAVGIAVVTLSLLAGKKLTKLVAIPAIALPVLFLADSFYWLYKFGHDLDPKAPLKIGTFTPQLFGNGEIGQFGTFAQPHLGFWLATAGAALAIAATVLRARVCNSCSRAGTCAMTCPQVLVLGSKTP